MVLGSLILGHADVYHYHLRTVTPEQIAERPLAWLSGAVWEVQAACSSWTRGHLPHGECIATSPWTRFWHLVVPPLTELDPPPTGGKDL